MSRVPGSPPRNTPPHAPPGLDQLLSVQRPMVLAHIRSIRHRNPDASPAQVIRILETRYLAAVTAGGAAVGASSVIPGVGVGISLALSGVETAGFLTTSALFAQSVTEVHGIAVEDPERARTLVMGMMLGSAGSDLVTQFAGHAAGTGATRGRFWGELVTKGLPKAAMGKIGTRIKKAFIRRLVATQSASAVGRAIPFGIGAVIGGTGNHLLGRKVVASSRDAFGSAPIQFPAVLDSVMRGPIERGPVMRGPVERGPVERNRRSRINLPRFLSGTAGSTAPKAPRPPKP
jgi:hypothetical protein